MKKMNKKGFTLAELLIVLAILAILIAIAIPVFGAQLENARITADHSNMRTAYSIVQTYNIMGANTSAGVVDVTVADGQVFCASGKFGDASAADAVTIQATSGNDSCATCVVEHTNPHSKGNKIYAVTDTVNGGLKVEVKP